MIESYHWKFSAESAQFDPKLRKATGLMKLVHMGIEKILIHGPLSTAEKPVQVFCSSKHGEIEPTLSYLKGLAQKDWARPFLFQNSLHHSTTGFVSAQFQLLGPCFSICAVNDPVKEVLISALVQVQIDPRPTLMIHGENFPSELAAISNFESENHCEIFYLSESQISQIQTKNKVSGVSQAICSFTEFSQLLQSQAPLDFHIEGFDLGFHYEGQAGHV